MREAQRIRSEDQEGDRSWHFGEGLLTFTALIIWHEKGHVEELLNLLTPLVLQGVTRLDGLDNGSHDP